MVFAFTQMLLQRKVPMLDSLFIWRISAWSNCNLWNNLSSALTGFHFTFLKNCSDFLVGLLIHILERGGFFFVCLFVLEDVSVSCHFCPQIHCQGYIPCWLSAATSSLVRAFIVAFPAFDLLFSFSLLLPIPPQISFAPWIMLFFQSTSLKPLYCPSPTTGLNSSTGSPKLQSSAHGLQGSALYLQAGHALPHLSPLTSSVLSISMPWYLRFLLCIPLLVSAQELLLCQVFPDSFSSRIRPLSQMHPYYP